MGTGTPGDQGSSAFTHRSRWVHGGAGGGGFVIRHSSATWHWQSRTLTLRVAGETDSAPRPDGKPELRNPDSAGHKQDAVGQGLGVPLGALVRGEGRVANRSFRSPGQF